MTDISIEEHSSSLYNFLLESKSGSLVMKHLKDIHFLYEKEMLLYLVDDMTKTKYFDLWVYEDYMLIIKSFKSDDLKIKYLKYVINEYNRYEIIISLDSDDNKIKCLKYLQELYYKALVVNSLADEYKMIKELPRFPAFYQEMIINCIISTDVLKELYNHSTINLQVVILKNMCDDNFKKEQLNNFKLHDQLEILKTFCDQKLLISILSESRYQLYISEFLDIITDQIFLVKLFDNCRHDSHRLKIIEQIKDADLKQKLISRLKNNFYKIALESNYDDKKGHLINNQDVSNINFDIDDMITFGVELEVCCDDAKTILMLKHILQNWTIVWDVSVQNGVEFVSPILKFCPRDLQTLKFICNFLEENCFYIDDSCGGHIHFGFDYFKSIEEFNIFLNLYGNVEDILYLISNRTGSRIRSRVLRYADKFKPVLENVSKLNIDWDKCCELSEYVKLINSQIKTKYYGLNLKSVNSEEKNTLEFRMPNGEINFDEVVLNIRLFAKLLEKAKEINELQNRVAKNKRELKLLELYNKLVSMELDDRTKVSYLLNIIFDNLEERNIYYKRYVNNANLNPKSFNSSKKVLCLKK